MNSFLTDLSIKLKLKHDINSIFAELVMFYAWIIFALNYSNPDFYNYEILYNYGPIGVDTRIEIGFVFICKILKFLGLSFITFRALLALWGLMLIKKCIGEYTNNANIVFIAYLFYPFFFDAIQIRMFVVSVLVLYSIRYLTKYTKDNLIKFLVLIGIATSFHTSAAFFIILLLAYIDDDKQVLKTSVIICLLELFLLNKSFIQAIISRFGFLGENFSTTMRYVNFRDSFRRLMWLYFCVDISTIVALHVLHRKPSLGKYHDVFYNYNDYNDTLIKCTYISLTMIPLFEIGQSWGRIYRAFLLVIYCAIVCYPLSYKTNYNNVHIKKLGKILFALFLSLTFFYFHILTGSNGVYLRVFRPMIENNYIYDFLFVR